MSARPDALNNLLNFGWQTESPHTLPNTHSIPDIIFWPVHLRHGVSLIHAAQSVAAAALSAQGSRVVLALEDNGLAQASAAASSFAGHVQDWFGLVPGASAPEVISLSLHSSIQKQQGDYPTRSWEIATGRLFNSIDLLGELKIGNLDNYSQEDLRSVLAANIGRLATPLVVWPYLHSILNNEPGVHVMTLGGEDKRSLWDHRDSLYGGPVSHLYLPRVRLNRHKPESLQWPVASDTLHALESARQGEWNDRNHPFRWTVEQGYCMPVSIIGNDDSLPTSWDELEPRLAEPQTLQHIASAIHAFMSHQNSVQ